MRESASPSVRPCDQVMEALRDRSYGSKICWREMRESMCQDLCYMLAKSIFHTQTVCHPPFGSS